jgi:hypothetical protein
MKYHKIIPALLLVVFPLFSQAQNTPAHKHRSKHHVIKASSEPSWAKAHNYDGASHVYFPDFRSFYDPQRGGYVFWENGAWSFTPTVPPYMSNVDLGKERVQILKGLDLDLHPELDYPRYMELYPAEHQYDKVPTPLPIAGSN